MAPRFSALALTALAMLSLQAGAQKYIVDNSWDVYANAECKDLGLISYTMSLQVDTVTNAQSSNTLYIMFVGEQGATSNYAFNSAPLAAGARYENTWQSQNVGPLRAVKFTLSGNDGLKLTYVPRSARGGERALAALTWLPDVVACTRTATRT